MIVLDIKIYMLGYVNIASFMSMKEAAILYSDC